MAEKAVELAKNKSAATHVHEFATDVENVIKNVEAKLGQRCCSRTEKILCY